MKQYQVRISENHYKKAKIMACLEGETLRNYIEEAIEKKLSGVSKHTKFHCQECGKWDTSKQKITFLRDCDFCGKKEILTVPRA